MRRNCSAFQASVDPLIKEERMRDRGTYRYNTCVCPDVAARRMQSVGRGARENLDNVAGHIRIGADASVAPPPGCRMRC